jgi:hypothetical protein
MNRPSTPEERKLADDFTPAQSAGGADNAVIALIDAQYDQALRYYAKSKALLDAANATAEELLDFQILPAAS